jgi:allantoate deiminase
LSCSLHPSEDPALSEPSVFPSATRILQRCEALSACSSSPGHITRLFLSDAQRAASELVARWMREAGMTVSFDALGTIVGRYEGERPNLPALLLGSHLDTIRDAGKYDGVLGVICAIECIDILSRNGVRKPFALEVVGFAETEGARFGTTLLSSRALAGDVDPLALEAVDHEGVTLPDAMRHYGLDPVGIPSAARLPETTLAYIELHIEQGTILEAEGLAVAAVTAITGLHRFVVEVGGVAGHAGTVPMSVRRDALTGAAECILSIERICAAQTHLVGTVGWIDTAIGSSNVIPARASFAVDVRAPLDDARKAAVAQIKQSLRQICRRRELTLSITDTHEAQSVPCSPQIVDLVADAITAENLPARRIPSTALHDAMSLAGITQAGMLFLRCKGGTSHNPTESVREEDVAVALHVMLRIIDRFKMRLLR